MYHCKVKTVLSRIVFISCLLFACCDNHNLLAQSAFLPLQSESNHYLSRLEILSGKISDEIHFSSAPFLRSSVVRYIDSLRLHMPYVIEEESKNVNYLLTDNDEWSGDSVAISRKPLLKIFYRDGLNHVGWNNYSQVNLKYRNEVYCRKRTMSEPAKAVTVAIADSTVVVDSSKQ